MPFTRRPDADSAKAPLAGQPAPDPRPAFSVHHVATMSRSYAVVWSVAGDEAAGRLDVAAARFELHGGGRDVVVPFADVSGAAIARSGAERLRGMPALVMRVRA